MRGLSLLVLVSAATAQIVSAQVPQGGPSEDAKITEWTVPWEKSRPRDPFIDSKRQVWFVGQQGNYIARLDPATGKFTKFEIDSGTHPHNLIVDKNGQVWYAGNRNGMIGRLDGATGKITRYPMPDPAVRDPHTLVFDKAEENIWFTSQGAGYVGRLAMKTGKIDVIKVPGERTRPYGIVIDSKGTPWVNLFGTNMIASVDTKTLAIKTWPLTHERTRNRRIAVTPDDQIWYVDYTRGYLGHLDPKTGKVEEFAAPSGGQSLPYAMGSDHHGRVWFVETGVQPNRLVGFDPRTKKYFSNTVVGESGGLTVRHMMWDQKANAFWFGTDANTIARGVVPPPKLVP
jgi:virginiamycin B lyase